MKYASCYNSELQEKYSKYSLGKRLPWWYLQIYLTGKFRLQLVLGTIESKGSTIAAGHCLSVPRPCSSLYNFQVLVVSSIL